jgi:outer membrane protein assembly factor BamD
MFKNKRIIRVAVIMLLAVMGITGCKSKFEKLRASNDTARKYQEAIKLYNNKKYSKALILFDDLIQRFRGQAEAEDLYYYHAYTNYRLKDYLTARHQFMTFVNTYPNSARAEECRFMSAYCYYLEAPVYTLDQSNTQKAIESLQLFINLYPDSERAEEAAGLIDELRDRLERKSYENAKLYLDIGDYQSAVIAFENSLRDYPDTKFAEEMEFSIIEAQYLFALNSSEYRQEDRYAEAISFADDFLKNNPDSKYVKDANKLKNDSIKKTAEVKKLLAHWAELQKESIERMKSRNTQKDTITTPQG